jgi:hypothetical protein
METSLLQNLAMNDNGFIFDPILDTATPATRPELIILKLRHPGLTKLKSVRRSWMNMM